MLDKLFHSVAIFFYLEVGDKLLNSKADDSKEQQLRALEEAVERAEARATKELKAALKRLREEKEEERKRALDKQKQVGRLSMHFYVRNKNYNINKKVQDKQKQISRLIIYMYMYLNIRNKLQYQKVHWDLGWYIDS